MTGGACADPRRRSPVGTESGTVRHRTLALLPEDEQKPIPEAAAKT
jgi:hypothetical protein